VAASSSWNGIFVQDGTVTHCTAAVNAGSGIEAPAEVVISFSSASDNGLDGINGGGVASNVEALGSWQESVDLCYRTAECFGFLSHYRG